MIRTMVVLAVLLAGICPVSHAETAGDINLNEFQMVGTVDAIDLQNYTVVVGDVQMRLAVDVRVRDSGGGVMALGQIQPGTKVGLMSDAEAGGASNLISEIRVLPADFALHGSE